MARTLIFLQLSAEFGGTRFGPFEGVEIRLGSDPSRNDITLPATLGVAPEHLKVLMQGEGGFLVAPIDRSCAVYLWRARSTKPRQITAPVAMQVGDGFSLVTPEGPRFNLVAEHAAVPKPSAAAGGMRPPSSKGMLAEIQRQGLSLFLRSKGGNFVGRAWTFIKTGQMFSPYYIILGVTMLGGWLFAGGIGCAALSFNSSKNEYQGQLQTCKDQLTGTTDSTGGPSVGSLTNNLLADREWSNTLKADGALMTSYADELVTAFAAQQRYRWVYTQNSSTFVTFKKSLESTGMPIPLVRVLAYAAAEPGYVSDRRWDITADSEGKEVCGRGPLKLTYRQGARLALASLSPDALVERQLAESNDVDAQAKEIERTAAAAGQTFESKGKRIVAAGGAQIQGSDDCLFIDDAPDDREDPQALARAIAALVGTGRTADLPREGEPFWVASRLVRLYTTDFTRGFDDVKFDSKRAPSTALKTQDVKTERIDYAIRSAARLMARSVAIPCFATLDKEVAEKPPAFIQPIPELTQCALIKTFVDYGRL